MFPLNITKFGADEGVTVRVALRIVVIFFGFGDVIMGVDHYLNLAITAHTVGIVLALGQRCWPPADTRNGLAVRPMDIEPPSVTSTNSTVTPVAAT